MQWFQHIDHVLPHKRVALSELSCAEDGECNNSSSSDIVVALAAVVATASPLTAAHCGACFFAKICRCELAAPVLCMTAACSRAHVLPVD